jgi:hypothetical protein
MKKFKYEFIDIEAINSIEESFSNKTIIELCFL